MDNLSTNVTNDAQAATSNPQAQAATTSDGQAPQETTPNNTSIDVLQRQIDELRKENAKHRKRNQEQEAASQREVEQRLKEQGEYQKLAEQHEARVKELEPLVDRYQSLSALVAEQLKAETKNWPKEVMALAPSDDAPIEQRLEWRTRSRALVDMLQQQARATMPGNAPNPRPAQQAPEGTHATYEQRLRATGKYGA